MCNVKSNLFTSSVRQGLSKRLDMQTSRLEAWFRARRKFDAPQPIKKFCDNA